MPRFLAQAAASALTTLQAVVLGAVQGLTEFIPVSSSAHLVLVPFFLGWPVPDLAFDVAVHLGTAVGVVVYFARDLARFLAAGGRTVVGRARGDDRTEARILALLVVGSIPAGIAGVFLEGPFEALFTDTEEVRRVGAPVVAAFLVGTAALLLLGEAVYGRRGGKGGGLGSMSLLDAVVVGLFQALAIAPGISRSGATISAGLFRGLDRESAARFSFLLSLPAILGAALVALPDLPPGADVGTMVAAAAAAAVTGFLAIAFLLRYLRTRSLRPFAAYCLGLAAVAFAFWLQTR